MGIEPEQIAKLWREHAPALRLLARTRCDMAEDALQEAFIALAKQPELPEEPVAWLVRVIRNRAISMARSTERRKQREQIVAREKPTWWMETSNDEPGLPPEEVQRAMEQLEPSVREILVAHLWTGMSFRQIAEAFELPSSTVHRVYTKGLTSLRQFLELASSTNQQATNQKAMNRKGEGR